ncbi:unnamed protein product [Rotaria sp. Silwood2]|nr:unnamed protein product [Rotaria sp. Silwood2]CAF2765420.1 unnamed protein product [Rotaria sp. Silwood2]CAF3016920.1 unnamed protein product [Rotaria sp. Silwood2]CAF3088809.1 unnamed protein product [Rotaria sp. Silwood2]CAF4144488.1 unnamed protein product [Rotaria sp. Silwood2]
MNASIHSDYEYINENEIDNELKCVICQQPLEFPVSLLICNHTFCKECIKKWLYKNQTCPICRQITRYHFEKNNQSFEQFLYVPINTRIVLNQLDRLLVRCLRCNEINIQRCHWKNHEKNCSKRIVCCPSADIKCPWKGSQDILSIHLNNCSFQQVRPIINELINVLNLTRIKQIELENHINILERKVSFLLKFINNGNIMIQNGTKPENEFNRTHQFICYLCNRYIEHEQILLHDCSGDCICRSCVNSQYFDRFQTWKSSNEQYVSSDSENIID